MHPVSATAIAVPRSARSIAHHSNEEAYLRFDLCADVSALLPMRVVQEALTLPIHRLTSIPNLPDCILGLTHRRSQVLWVVDLAKFLGFNHLEPIAQQYDIAIAQVEGISVAIAVGHIINTVWLAPDAVQPPMHPDHLALARYLHGWVSTEGGGSLLVLDAAAIARSSVLQGHASEFG